MSGFACLAFRFPKSNSWFSGSLFLACALLVSGCTTQVYDGAARPDEDISVLSLLRSEPNMTFGGVVIDGKSVSSTRYGFSTDFQLLPGSHTLSFTYRIDADAYCDVREHLCPAIVVEGHCSGAFPSQAGKSYVAELVNRKQSVGVVVREALSMSSLMSGTGGAIAELDCQPKGSHASLDAQQADLVLKASGN